MARRHQPLEGRGGLILEAVGRLSLAPYCERLNGRPDRELCDTDPAMARLTVEEREWCRDYEAGRLGRYGSSQEAIVSAFGPWNDGDRGHLDRYVTRKATGNPRAPSARI